VTVKLPDVDVEIVPVIKPVCEMDTPDGKVELVKERIGRPDRVVAVN
jgi:hypothetical protein